MGEYTMVEVTASIPRQLEQLIDHMELAPNQYEWKNPEQYKASLKIWGADLHFCEGDRCQKALLQMCKNVSGATLRKEICKQAPSHVKPLSRSQFLQVTGGNKVLV